MGKIETIIDRTKDLTINTATGRISKEDLAAAVTSMVIFKILQFIL